MTIFERIKADHETQRNLMQTLLDTSGDSDERQAAFAEFCREFESHAAAEEEAFYAPMMESADTTDQSRHSVAEHQSAMELLETLQNTDMSSPAWIASFKKLADENEHHMQEEEEDVFPLVRKHMSSDEIDGMLPAFDSRKRDELASSH